ncbi:MAG: DUF808 domain-containing protein [Campylobacterales bacterium]|nr:DUF808 domain-containing protein [Campylobacterales bacterium]
MTPGFFAVFDDIATLLDDAAAMSKVATKKTAGILGDDLAVNAQKASGFASSRELPVLWVITKGSFINKLIILPLAFLLSAFAPWAIVPILLFGGLYLAYEGAHKVDEYIFPHKVHQEKEQSDNHEAQKIKSAIRTDFILSIEIVIIALGTVMQESLFIQIIAVSVVAFLATIGVYGIVALIVRMDDFGFKLMDIAKSESSILYALGDLLVDALPKLIRILTFVGTVAMLLVAGGIFTHNIHTLHEILPTLPSIVLDLFVGIIIGYIALLVQKLFIKLRAYV